MKKLYFAYGSNMNQTRIEQRIGEVVRLGKHVIFGYKLAFNCGYEDKRFCNIIATGNNDDFVEGVVYELSTAQLRALDRFEGAPRWYTRFSHKYNKKDLYVYMCINPLYKPYKDTLVADDYLKHIIKGCNQNKISLGSVLTAVSRN